MCVYWLIFTQDHLTDEIITNDHFVDVATRLENFEITKSVSMDKFTNTIGCELKLVH